MAHRSNKVDIGSMSEALAEVMDEYTYAADSTIQRIIDEVAESTAGEIKAKAPGKNYPSTWTTGYAKRKEKKYTKTVYAGKPGYALAHLLENGHLMRNGKTSPKYSHIAPAAADAETEIVAKIKEALKG